MNFRRFKQGLDLLSGFNQVDYTALKIGMVVNGELGTGDRCLNERFKDQW